MGWVVVDAVSSAGSPDGWTVLYFIHSGMSFEADWIIGGGILIKRRPCLLIETWADLLFPLQFFFAANTNTDSLIPSVQVHTKYIHKAYTCTKNTYMYMYTINITQYTWNRCAEETSQMADSCLRMVGLHQRCVYNVYVHIQYEVISYMYMDIQNASYGKRYKGTHTWIYMYMYIYMQYTFCNSNACLVVQPCSLVLPPALADTIPRDCKCWQGI